MSSARSVIVYLGCAAAVLPYLVRLSWTVAPDSDGATAALMALDMLKGNWLLHGWWLPPTLFWLTDLPVYTAALAVQGFGPAVLHVAPALMYVGLLSLVAVAAAGPFDKRTPAAWCAAGVALLPLIFPAPLATAIALGGLFHVSTIAAVLAFLLVMERGYAAGRLARSKASTVLAAMSILVLTAAIIGDPFAVWIGLLPVIIVSSLDGAALYFKKPAADAAGVAQVIYPPLFGLGSWLVASAALWLAAAHGGFTRMPLPPVASMFVQLDHVGKNLQWLVQDILDLNGGNVFGSRASAGAFPIFVRLAGCLASGVAVWLVLRRWRRGYDVDWLSRVLAVSSVLLVAAFEMSQFSTVEGSRSARYLMPVVVFGWILAGRFAGRVLPLLRVRKAWIAATAVVVAAAYALIPLGQMLLGAPAFPAAELTAFLQQHGLERGLGDYWDASVVTLTSRGAVTVRPVVSEGSRIVPYRWNSTRRWYSPDTRFTFLVFDSTNWGNVGWETAARTFGQPTDVYRVNAFTILVWRAGISVSAETADP